MDYRPLGTTGLSVSAISFGAGPVSQLLTGDPNDSQRATVEAALAAGINWFDTAATYGEGRSESNLGRSLDELRARDHVQVATKVRLMSNDLLAIGRAVRSSVFASLQRLQVERITLLQIHNSITAQAGSQPTSITPSHVLAEGGVLPEMQKLQREGLVQYLGLTGLGEPDALSEVIASGAFATIQIPYNLLNRSAGEPAPADFGEANYGNLITACAARGMGTMAIRVLAGGALVGRAPSPHTLKTPFFPVDLYERDQREAGLLEARLPQGSSLKETAVRFALSHPGVSSAIIGFATPDEVWEIARFAAAGPLDVGI
jgi:aryl-alcohol dehydrogenase-like predicted oxidoreductase